MPKTDILPIVHVFRISPGEKEKESKRQQKQTRAENTAEKKNRAKTQQKR